MNFDFIFLGQSVLRYQVPLEVFVGLNELYETQKKHLPNANTQLAGKIPDEVSLFYAGPTNKKMHAHSFVSEDILKWFYSIFDHYLRWNKTQEFNMNINSIWVNEMKAGDYNPVHIHLDWASGVRMFLTMGSNSSTHLRSVAASFFEKVAKESMVRLSSVHHSSR